MAERLTADSGRHTDEALRERVSSSTIDLLDGRDGRYTEWATACAIATDAMNKGLTENEFARLVRESDFAYEFATESGRDRSNRLDSRLSKVWSKVEEIWTPPIGNATDVRARLAALSARLDDHRWGGRTGSKDRAVALSLVSWAHEVGVWTLDASTRELAVRAGVSRGTASRALGRLTALGVISPDDSARSARDARRWVLNLGWTTKGQTGTHKPFPPNTRSCGPVMSLPSTGHPAFLGAALGQTSERVWLDLLDHPDSTVGEVADRLGITSKTVRRSLDSKLVANQLVTKTEGRPSRYAVDPSADTDRLNQVADAYGTLDWRDRNVERYERERDGYVEFLRQAEARRPVANTDDLSHEDTDSLRREQDDELLARSSAA